MSKPVLYSFGGSVWGAVAELVVAELYPEGSIDIKTVHLVKGENFFPEFVSLNPNATLPTLVTPDEGTKTSTKEVVQYLIDRSGKKAGVKPGTEIIDYIHRDEIDPNTALFVTRNDEEVKAKAASVPGAYHAGRQETLVRLAKAPEGEKFRPFYETKLAANTPLNALFQGEASDKFKSAYFEKSKAHYTRVAKTVYEYLPSILPADGFIGGENPGEDDYHVGGWLTRIAATIGATSAGDGVDALEKAYGEGQPLPPNVAAYWKSWSARPSWKKVYAEALH